MISANPKTLPKVWELLPTSFILKDSDILLSDHFTKLGSKRSSLYLKATESHIIKFKNDQPYKFMPLEYDTKFEI